jgi:glycosyltransferase involved in cell wall biosynthesis
MFVKNSFEYDARVTKEAKSLVAAGHDVTVVAIHVPGKTAEREVTKDAIRVVRVSRMSFGMRLAQRTHARYVVGVEERHARLSGTQVDEERVRKYTAVVPASTATPGDNDVELVRRRARPEPATAAPSGLAALWAKTSTAVLRAGSMVARWGFRAARFVLVWPLRAARVYRLNRRFIAAGLETGADVWHSHDLNTLYVGSQCKAKRPGTRLVYDSHELATQRSRMGRVRRWWAGWNERRGLRHADEVIMTTRSRARYQVERYGIGFPNLIRNVPEIIEIESGWDLHERLGIPADRRILLYQGSIQEYRGIEEAIEAVTMLELCVLVVIGYGYHRPALEEMVRRRGLGELVRFFGPIPNDELLYYTASADVGLCVIRGESLSYRWSLPNKLFEYMMAGIPVVASDYEEMGRVVTEEGVGTVCDPGDPESIAAAVRAIVDDPEAEARFRAATRTAITRYNWGVEEQVLLGIYERLGSAGEET